MPETYHLIAAAKYLNTTPWELLERSVYWSDKALLYMTAEAQGQKIKKQHQ
jgi:hypothetical protein